MKKTGFTLIEMMVVLTIMLILASISLPMLNRTLVNYRLKKGGDTIRAEWVKLRIKAMEEGQIICCRAMIGGNQMLVDYVMDAHFAAAMRVDDNNLQNNAREGTPEYYEKDRFYTRGFTGTEEDFILRDPSILSIETGSKIVLLPDNVYFSDMLAIPDERAAYYLGYTVDDNETNMSNDPVQTRDTRFGETRASDGTMWSAPVFFFPDGTTSTAAALLKNETNRCMEIRQRGLTGTVTIGSIVFPEDYTGELDPQTVGMTKAELDELEKNRIDRR